MIHDANFKLTRDEAIALTLRLIRSQSVDIQSCDTDANGEGWGYSIEINRRAMPLVFPRRCDASRWAMRNGAASVEHWYLCDELKPKNT